MKPANLPFLGVGYLDPTDAKVGQFFSHPRAGSFALSYQR
jgi:hypothetical protein